METTRTMDAQNGAEAASLPAEANGADTAETPIGNLPQVVTPKLPSGKLDPVHDIPVRVQAALGRSRMTVAELVNLAKNDVVELDRKVGEPVDIFVNNRLIARGEVVMVDQRLGVTLTEIVKLED